MGRKIIVRSNATSYGDPWEVIDLEAASFSTTTYRGTVPMITKTRNLDLENVPRPDLLIFTDGENILGIGLIDPEGGRAALILPGLPFDEDEEDVEDEEEPVAYEEEEDEELPPFVELPFGEDEDEEEE